MTPEPKVANAVWWLRCIQWIAGFGVHKTIDYAFDYALYPWVIFKLGLLYGGIVMAVLSCLDCLVLLRIYDWLKRDWLGIEFVKEIQNYAGTSRLMQALRWLLTRGDGIAFLVLSIRFDPFITTAYLRRGRYNGLSSRDWRIFFGSVIVSNTAWALVCWSGVSVYKKLFG